MQKATPTERPRRPSTPVMERTAKLRVDHKWIHTRIALNWRHTIAKHREKSRRGGRQAEWAVHKVCLVMVRTIKRLALRGHHHGRSNPSYLRSTRREPREARKDHLLPRSWSSRSRRRGSCRNCQDRDLKHWRTTGTYMLMDSTALNSRNSCSIIITRPMTMRSTSWYMGASHCSARSTSMAMAWWNGESSCNTS